MNLVSHEKFRKLLNEGRLRSLELVLNEDKRWFVRGVRKNYTRVGIRHYVNVREMQHYIHAKQALNMVARIGYDPRKLKVFCVEAAKPKRGVLTIRRKDAIAIGHYNLLIRGQVIKEGRRWGHYAYFNGDKTMTTFTSTQFPYRNIQTRFTTFGRGTHAMKYFSIFDAEVIR